ncbi:4-hydroxy-tetrahydrodipicolinate reductase [Winogradskyella sp. A3E31]|uniref:4-hydroxy-tetrahydrodipicolinate reductase n=1 Tax=Winogradskyella sp. A3E31 TaxID=3349637 RepID=UPI00398B28D1
MNIALLGYGKMGKMIEQIAIDRGHSISFKTNDPFSANDLASSDIAIDFSLPDAAVSNIKSAIDAGIPVISGTTGWLDSYDEAVNYCNSHDGAFIYASNFSLGVNIFFEVNNLLAKLIGTHEDYKADIEEIHHTQKLDAPSGTAITLAEGVIENTEYTKWTLDEPKAKELQIEAKRIENVPGTHEVNYNSEVDSISIKHTAHNRKGFALGAVVAAEWLIGKKGVFTMKDVLNIG